MLTDLGGYIFQMTSSLSFLLNIFLMLPYTCETRTQSILSGIFFSTLWLPL